MIENKEQENNFLIYPAKLSRRILSFFADGFIAFIFAIFIFELAILPLVKVISGYGEKSDNYNSTVNARYDYLYENDLMSYAAEEEKYIYSYAFDATANNFIKYYVFDNDENLAKFEIFSNYYIGIKGRNQEFLATTIYKFSTNETFKKFFNCESETFNITLKDSYKELIKPFYLPEDKISSDGEAAMKEIKGNFIEGNFLAMFSDLNENDSYFKSLNEKITDYQSYLNNCYMIGASITFVLTAIIFYLVIPLIDKRGRTIGKIILKIQRIKKDNFKTIRTFDKVSIFLLSMLEIFPILMFIPWISAGFAGIFALPYLLYISIIGFTYDLISLLIGVFTAFRQSVKELLTSTIIVETSVMDELFVQLGYDL